MKIGFIAIIRIQSLLKRIPFSCFRGAQPERSMPVSGRTLHTANHSVPRLCSEHRRCPSQRSPQCTAVPQNHGWRKVTSSSSLQIWTRHYTMLGEISTLDNKGTFVMRSSNVNYLRFGSGDIFCPQINPWHHFWSLLFLIVAIEDYVARSSYIPHIILWSFFFLYILFASHPRRALRFPNL